MDFINLVEMIQVFANQFCEPSSVVLVYGNVDEIELIKHQFKFITSEVVSMDTSPGKNVDIVVSENYLPFEKHSFDLIISFKGNCKEFKRVLKPHGNLLSNDLVIDAIEIYSIGDQMFYVT
jgi:hypothetical protein